MFDSDAEKASQSQSDIYQYFRPNVIAAVRGYNYVLLACGAKGSGKTHTMVGGHNWDESASNSLHA